MSVHYQKYLMHIAQDQGSGGEWGGGVCSGLSPIWLRQATKKELGEIEGRRNEALLEGLRLMKFHNYDKILIKH